MSQAILRSVPAIAVLLGTMMFSASVDAQPSFRDSLVQAQTLIRDGMRQVIHQELMLDDDEQAAFWPLYDKYDAEFRTIDAKYIDLVSEFVERYEAGEMSDDDADRLLDASLDIEMDRLQIRHRYVRHFRKILSGLQVARLYQLGHKVRAEVDAALALAIPLADPS